MTTENQATDCMDDLSCLVAKIDDGHVLSVSVCISEKDWQLSPGEIVHRCVLPAIKAMQMRLAEISAKRISDPMS